MQVSLVRFFVLSYPKSIDECDLAAKLKAFDSRITQHIKYLTTNIPHALVFLFFVFRENGIMITFGGSLVTIKIE